MRRFGGHATQARKADELAAGSNDAMAGHEDRPGIIAQRRSDRTGRLGIAGAAATWP